MSKSLKIEAIGIEPTHLASCKPTSGVAKPSLMAAHCAGRAMAAALSGIEVSVLGVATPNRPLIGPDGAMMNDGAAVIGFTSPPRPPKSKKASWKLMASLAFMDCAGEIAQVFVKNHRTHSIDSIEFVVALLTHRPTPLRAKLSDLMGRVVGDEVLVSAMSLAATFETAALLSQPLMWARVEMLAAALDSRQFAADDAKSWNDFIRSLAPTTPKKNPGPILKSIGSEATARSLVGDNSDLPNLISGEITFPYAHKVH